jgi:hypothetical protein
LAQPLHKAGLAIGMAKGSSWAINLSGQAAAAMQIPLLQWVGLQR